MIPPSNAAASPSIAEFIEKAERGAALTVVFFGGSLTAGANASDPNTTSWRGRIMRRFREVYPRARWNFIDSAIGGTNSNLGIYRLERDVLRHHSDLLFLDFSLNDGLESTGDLALDAYEGILRKVLESGTCALFPVILPRRSFVTAPDISIFKRRVAHRDLFRHYGLAFADVVETLRARYAEGTLDLNTIWPPELFDTVHPFDGGYELYEQIVFSAFQAAAHLETHPAVPEQWLNRPTFRNVLRFRLPKMENPPHGWNAGYAEVRSGTFDFLCSRWQDGELTAANCQRTDYDKFHCIDVSPAPLRLKFRGSTLSLFGEATIHSCRYRYAVDGGPLTTVDPVPFAQAFSPAAYDSRVLAEGLDPETVHSFILEPLFTEGVPQILKLESICAAGPECAQIMD